MVKWLNQVPDVDLAVFPECMPFWNDKPPKSHKAAIKFLEKVGAEVRDATFIAGGYIRDGQHTYNRSFLVNRGVVEHHYDKQILFEGEDFTPGPGMTHFTWAGHSCIPLICADAGDNLTPKKVRMMASALDVGAGTDVPIVISSYGGGLMTDYWQPALKEWSQGCGAPVLICGIAGVHKESRYTDVHEVEHPFGGGGSGVFWPDGTKPCQFVEPGIVLVDILKKTATHQYVGKRS